MCMCAQDEEDETTIVLPNLEETQQECQRIRDELGITLEESNARHAQAMKEVEEYDFWHEERCTCVSVCLCVCLCVWVSVSVLRTCRRKASVSSSFEGFLEFTRPGPDSSSVFRIHSKKPPAQRPGGPLHMWFLGINSENHEGFGSFRFGSVSSIAGLVAGSVSPVPVSTGFRFQRFVTSFGLVAGSVLPVPVSGFNGLWRVSRGCSVSVGLQLATLQLAGMRGNILSRIRAPGDRFGLAVFVSRKVVADHPGDGCSQIGLVRLEEGRGGAVTGLAGLVGNRFVVRFRFGAVPVTLPPVPGFRSGSRASWKILEESGPGRVNSKKPSIEEDTY